MKSYKVYNSNLEREKYWVGDIIITVGHFINILLLLMWVVTMFMPDKYRFECVGHFKSYRINYSEVDPVTHEVREGCNVMVYTDFNGKEQTIHPHNEYVIARGHIEVSGNKYAYVQNLWLHPCYWAFTFLGFLFLWGLTYGLLEDQHICHYRAVGTFFETMKYNIDLRKVKGSGRISVSKFFGYDCGKQAKRNARI